MKLHKMDYLALAVIFTAIFLCGISTIWSPYRDSGAPTWNGITPGETTLAQVLFKMGPPKEFQSRDGCIRLSYLGDPFAPEYIKGWGKIDVLLKPIAGNFMVVLIHRDDLQTTPPNNPFLLDEGNLKFLVLENGRPDKVTWSAFTHFRVLIWARKGMAVTAFSMGPLEDWDSQVLTRAIVEVTLFAPTDIQHLLVYDSENDQEFTANYPCASLMPARSLPVDKKPPSSAIRDPGSEDPYDWEHMPTPSATGTP